MTIHVGFTGTSKHGMTVNQISVLTALLTGSDFVLHHGDCIGADEGAHRLARMLGGKIIIHPPLAGSKQAHCRNADIVRPRQPYLVRNEDIVRECDVLVAAPNELTEQRRSGTWATIRYARKAGKPVVILEP